MLKRLRDGAHGVAIVVGFKPHVASRFVRTLVLAAPLLLYVWIPAATLVLPTLIAYLGRIDINVDGVFRAVPVTEMDSRPTIPVTIVDMDDATWRQWSFPRATPREHLRDMVARVAHAGALVIVPDIELSGHPESGNGQADPFLAYLQGYPETSPAIVLPKRIDAVTGQATPSAYDQVVGYHDPATSAHSHRNLIWVDAALTSESDGVIRRWALWREVCTGAGSWVMPTVVAGALSMLRSSGTSTLPTLERPRASGRCIGPDAQPAPLHVLVRRNYARRQLTGSGTTTLIGPPGNSLIAVPARLLLDSDAQLDDESLFRNRVVFIGASHAASRDWHRTVYGDLPGVEIWAQQVHLAPLQNLRADGYRAGFRLAVSALFALLVVIDLFVMRPKTLTWVVALLIAALCGVKLLRYVATYEAIGTAVMLMVALTGLRSVFNTIEDWRSVCQRSPDLKESRPLRQFFLRPWPGSTPKD